MYVHGDNIAQKKAHRRKYRDQQSVQCLSEIEAQYEAWKKANLDLKGLDRQTVDRRTELLNGYKDFIDLQKYAEMFDSRSNLHSSVLEEFLVYLFQYAIPNLQLNPIIQLSARARVSSPSILRLETSRTC